MKTLAKIEGQIVGQQVMQPPEGKDWKPFRAIQVLQKAGDSVELVTVKNYDLGTEYTDKKFVEMCAVSSWAGRNGTSGLNISVAKK